MHSTAELMTEVTRGAMRSLCVVGMLLVSSGAAAQGGAVWIGAGATVPTGGTGDRYTIGPAAAFSLETELKPRVAVRLDAEWSRVSGGKLSTYPADLRTYGASLNALLRFSEGDIVLYALAGLGGYRLQRLGDEPSVYGTTAAVQVGSGIEVRAWDTVEPFVEARGVMHITDYASDEFTASVLWPLLAGLRFPLRR